MGSLLSASGAHVIKIYHSFTIRRDQVDRFKYRYNAAKLRCQQLATHKASASDELRAQLPPATLARLKELLRFDYALYDEAKRRARAAAAKELPLYTHIREDVS
jgi:hypothetical protein